jgi:hypothetical protein
MPPSSDHPAILPGAEPWSHHAPAGGADAGGLDVINVAAAEFVAKVAGS